MNATSPPNPSAYFVKGGKPGPGRPPGQKNARQRLAEMVFTDVLAHWEEQGQGFLRRLAFHDYAAFASFVAKILPQRIEIETATPFDHVDEALLAISLRISKSVAFLPPEDRELLDMLLDKGELLASQKNFEAEKSEEGVGAKDQENFVGVKGTPHPQNASSPPLLIGASTTAAGSPVSGGIHGAAASRIEAEDVIVDDPDEEGDNA